jgi:predicted nuclease with TOPRIM domain
MSKRYLNVLTTGDIKDTHTEKLIRGSRIGDELNKLYEENEQLEKDVARYRGNFREMEDVKCELAEENEQLKSENKKLNERIGILEGSLIDKGFDIND